MKKILLVLGVIFAVHSFCEQEVEFETSSEFIAAVRDIRLIAIDVDIWDDDETRDQIWINREESLERQISQKLKARGLEQNVYQELKQLPDYQEFQAYYDEQFDQAAYLSVNIYKRYEKIFVDLTFWKNTYETKSPLFSRLFSYTIGEDEEDDWWWIIIKQKILEHVENFLETFCRVNPGPYGWVLHN